MECRTFEKQDGSRAADKSTILCCSNCRTMRSAKSNPLASLNLHLTSHKANESVNVPNPNKDAKALDQRHENRVRIARKRMVGQNGHFSAIMQSTLAYYKKNNPDYILKNHEKKLKNPHG